MKTPEATLDADVLDRVGRRRCRHRRPRRRRPRRDGGRRRPVDRPGRASRSRSRWPPSTGTEGSQPRSGTPRSRSPRDVASAAAPRSTAASTTGSPALLAESWRHEYAIEEFGSDMLDSYAERIENQLAVSRPPAPHRRRRRCSSECAPSLGWQAVEYARVPVRRRRPGRQADDVTHTAARRSMLRNRDPELPGTPACGATDESSVSAVSAPRTARRRTYDPRRARLCAGAIQTPALLHRSGIRRHRRGSRCTR